MASDVLWGALAKGDTAARDALLKENLSLVHHVARQLSRALAAPADVDELVSCGTLGLVSALEAFDPSRGLAFSTFAVPRIRGAILDELRRQDHVPRSVRRKSRSLSRARETLSRVLGRPATYEELAEHLGIDLPTLWRWEADSENSVHLSLDHSESEAEEGTTQPHEIIAFDDGPDVEEELNREQEMEVLVASLKKLKEQERIVLSLYYFEEMKLHEIASVLGLTESRVSQVRTKALGRLRTELAHLRLPA